MIEEPLFDTHVHTALSPDSEMPPEVAIDTLNKLGLGCIFTEHVDMNPQGELYFSADTEVYFREYTKFKSPTVKMGLEFGLTVECAEICREIASNPLLDYCLGSVHIVDGLDIGCDPTYLETVDDEVYRRYLDYMLENVKANDYIDVLGHIDYISRYSPFAEKNVIYENYVDEYDRLLKELVQRDIVLELSTKRLDDESACKNLATIYQRYKNLGGRYVTIGSDAHLSSRLGYKFDVALVMINEIGLTPCYFRERRMVVCTQI